jgi:hypothetical protein
MNRALRYDGLLAAKTSGSAGEPGLTPEDVREMRAYAEDNRQHGTPFDIVCEGETPGQDSDRAASIVRPFSQAGATWWIEALWSPPNEPRDLSRRRAAPHRVGNSAERGRGSLRKSSSIASLRGCCYVPTIRPCDYVGFGEREAMNDPVKEVADRVLRDVAERENGVPGVVAMTTDR